MKAWKYILAQEVTIDGKKYPPQYLGGCKDGTGLIFPEGLSSVGKLVDVFENKMDEIRMVDVFKPTIVNAMLGFLSEYNPVVDRFYMPTPDACSRMVSKWLDFLNGRTSKEDVARFLLDEMDYGRLLNINTLIENSI